MPEIMTTGRWRSFSSDLMRSRTSMPSIPGISMSSRITSGGSSPIAARAAAPSFAEVVRSPSRASVAVTRRRLSASSSTTGTCPVRRCTRSSCPPRSPGGQGAPTGAARECSTPPEAAATDRTGFRPRGVRKGLRRTPLGRRRRARFEVMTEPSTFRRLWQPPGRYEDRATDRRVTFLELFFDLVFVVVISQLARRLAAHPSWSGVGWFVFLFYAVWSSWLNGTLYHDLHTTNDVSVRVFTFGQML